MSEFEQALSSPAELARWVEVHHGDHPEWVEELRRLLPVPAGREPTRDFELQVSVRVYGPGDAEAAAEALRRYRSTFDMPGDAECEILAAVPVLPAEVSARVDEFLDHPETGTRRTRPTR